MGIVRILFLADTHLGFDYPFRPRVERRRRGDDFFLNFTRALEPARRGEVDAVVHGGDILFRSKVPARLVDMAFAPLRDIADLGVKVFLVPGNHERSRIPFGLLAVHRNIHIFSQPSTFFLKSRGTTVALSGFPYWRHNVRRHFSCLLEETGWRQVQHNIHSRLLCVHHCFEGAKVGPVNYTFRNGEDVIKTSSIPAEFTAVLSGHIHRFQILTSDLKSLPLKVPIFYPGSIERTSFAEKDEPKGYLILEIDPDSKDSILSGWHFHELPTRPMIKVVIDIAGLDPYKLRNLLKTSLGRIDPHSVVRIEIRGKLEEKYSPVLRAAEIRSICPREMNVSQDFPVKQPISLYREHLL
ncbi:MAG: metallophosphoesterase [Candidatus Aminicenantes bacterium]|nr:metallophosphoesterase [Candidatus Aminicenantes bacterium]